MSAQKIVPVIMAGGKGTPLWPLSRAGAPKQFLQFLGQHSLFQKTLQRVGDHDLYAPALIVTTPDFRSSLWPNRRSRLARRFLRSLLEPGCPQHRPRACRGRAGNRTGFRPRCPNAGSRLRS